MVRLEFLPLNFLRMLIEGISALVIVGHCVGGLYFLAVKRNVRQAQLIVANGALLGFSIKLIATVLAVIELQTWEHISMFVCVFALRIILKKVLQREKRVLESAERFGSGVRA